MKLRCLITAALLLAASIAVAEKATDHPAVGTWVGAAEAGAGGYRFDLELKLEDGELAGEIVLVSEGSVRMPADKIEVEENRIRVVTMQGAISISGEIDGETITGKLHTPSDDLPMRLARADSDAARRMLAGMEEERKALRSKPLVLVRSGPGMETVDPKALEALLADADSSFTTALALMHDGELVGEWYRGEAPEPVETMSVTKVALNLIIGRMITLGRLESVDTPVHAFYPQWADDEVRASITIRQLLAHSSGLDRGQPAAPIYHSGDFVQFALDAPMEFEPGTQVAYSNNGTNLLGGIIGQLADKPLTEFLAEDLFGLIGIEEFTWHPDPAGNPQGMAGLKLKAADLARLGQLALDHGRWQGEQLINADWFEESFAPATEHSARVGLIWFLDRDGEDEAVVGISHSGHLGQWLGARFDNRVVGARLIAQSPAYEVETDVFMDFVQRLGGLAPAADRH